MIIKLKAPPRSPATGFLICAALDAAPKPPPSAIKVLDPSRSAENRAAAQGLQPLVIQSLKSSIWSLGKYGPPAGIWPNPAGLFGSHNVPGVPRSACPHAGMLAVARGQVQAMTDLGDSRWMQAASRGGCRACSHSLRSSHAHIRLRLRCALRRNWPHGGGCQADDCPLQSEIASYRSTMLRRQDDFQPLLVHGNFSCLSCARLERSRLRRTRSDAHRAALGHARARRSPAARPAKDGEPLHDPNAEHASAERAAARFSQRLFCIVS